MSSEQKKGKSSTKQGREKSVNNGRGFAASHGSNEQVSPSSQQQPGFQQYQSSSMPPQGYPMQLPPGSLFPANMLQELSARGPGEYRVRMNLIPPNQHVSQQQQQAQYYHPTFPQQPQGVLPFPYQYYPGVNPSLVPYPGMSVFHMQEMGAAENPEMPSVAMYTLGKQPNDPNDPNQKKTNRRKKRKNPKAPKPARYAWNFYFKEKYQQLRRDGGDGLFDVQEAFTKVGERLGNAWKSLSTEERKPYIEMAAKDRERYEREMELFHKGLDFKADTKEKEEREAKKQRIDDKSVENKGNTSEKPADDETSIVQPAAKNIQTNEDMPHQVTADILVTDDDDAFILMVEAKLKRLNQDLNGKGRVHLNIHKAKSGTEALAKVVDEQQKYLVITMDKEMGPESPDGYQTIKRMRESGYNGFVVGLTGNPDCEKSFATNGADATLTKGSAKLYTQIYDYVIEKLNNEGSEAPPHVAERPAEQPISSHSNTPVANRA